ncbi:hypothetical protein D3C75_660960 [compost metagenome]
MPSLLEPQPASGTAMSTAAEARAVHFFIDILIDPFLVLDVSNYRIVRGCYILTKERRFMDDFMHKAYF